MIHQPSIFKRLEDTVCKDFVDVAQTDLTQRALSVYAYCN